MTHTHSRRTVLATGAALTGMLAGCTQDQGKRADSTVELSAIPNILAEPVPEVQPSAPIIPAEEPYRDARTRTTTLLNELPVSIAQSDVPNGVVREHIDDHRSRAREHIDTASVGGERRYHAFVDTVDARADARQAATMYEAVERYRQNALAELSESLRSEHTAVEPTVRDARQSVSYMGPTDGPELYRALALYTTAEHALDNAERRLANWELRPDSTVVDLGEAAATLESAQAATDVWSHLLRRYADDRPAATALQPLCETAISATRQRIDAVDLPTREDDDWVQQLIDQDIDENSIRWEVLYESVDPVYRARDDLAEAATTTPMPLADGLTAALRVEQEYRAFKRVRQRVAEELSPEINETTVQAEREAAIEAAQTAADAISGPSMARNRLAETVRSITYADGSLEILIEDGVDGVTSMRGEYLEYVCLRERLTVLPAAARAFRERLQEA